MCAKQKNSTGAILIMLLSVIIGMFMIVMDNTAVNIAIPTLVTEMNTTNVMIQWVVSAYTLAPGRSNTTFGLDDGSFWL